MNKVQFIYDYQCPFCKKGFDILAELLPGYPKIEIEWVPVESNPGPGANPCIEACYTAMELGADMVKYNASVFKAIFNEGRNTNKPDVLAGIAEKFVNRADFSKLLKSGKYTSKNKENNDLAYEKEGVWYVPSLRAGGLKLDAKGGVGISRDELKAFLEKASG
ncbi:MAG: DsbA family protein [Treponema sp.]|nr:DsbA family protein [Treponema sp.]